MFCVFTVFTKVMAQENTFTFKENHASFSALPMSKVDQS